MVKSNARAESDQLFKLQVQGDKYARLLVEQKQRLRQFDAEYRKVHEELKELRLRRSEGDQRGGGANAVRARLADEQRELMKLENRLSACRTRESKMAAQNVDLRQRVDALRAGRVLSQSVFEKNQKKLREIQRQMQDCFRVATQIVAERDRMAAQAYAMTTNNMDEQESFDSVFESLAAIIKREKENAETYRKQILEQDPLEVSDDFMRGNMKMDDEQKLKKTLQRLEQNLKDDKESIGTINDQLQDFDSAFNALQLQMGVEDYHELLAVYTKKEEENFALFRYVQSLNNEIEQLEEDKHKLERETEKLQNQMKDGTAHARKRMIDDLVETRQRILKENADYERLRASAQREFQPIARAVDRLYNALGCNDIVPPEMNSSTSNSESGGASKSNRKQSEDQMAMMARINSMNDILAAHGITEGNILQFLAIIEQRSNELIEHFSRGLQYKNPMEFSRATLGANLKPSDPSRAVVAAKSMIPSSSGGLSSGYTAPTSANANPTNALGVAAGLVGNGISGAGTLTSLLSSSSLTVNASSIAEEDLEINSSDDEEGDDRPMTKAELQRRAAKTLAGLQFNPKLQTLQRGKPAVSVTATATAVTSAPVPSSTLKKTK